MPKIPVVNTNTKVADAQIYINDKGFNDIYGNTSFVNSMRYLSWLQSKGVNLGQYKYVEGVYVAYIDDELKHKALFEGAWVLTPLGKVIDVGNVHLKGGRLASQYEYYASTEYRLSTFESIMSENITNQQFGGLNASGRALTKRALERILDM